MLPFSLFTQDCEITLIEDDFVCGFEKEVQASPSDGVWSYDCSQTNQLVFIEDEGDGLFAFTFSECGIYELVYTVEVLGACTNSDTLTLYIDDPSSSTQTVDFDNGLEYDQVSCHSGNTGFCTNQVSIQGFPPPIPIWSFCGNGNCMINETIVTSVEDMNNPCFAEAIDVMPIQINNAYSSCWDTEQDSFIIIAVDADTVIENSFLSYLDSLLYNEILANLGDCSSSGTSCFSVSEECIDSINYDTTAFYIPVHLGGGWNVLIESDTIALSDSTSFTIQSREYFMIMEPGANYYGPDAIGLTLFELVNGGSDTIDLFENLSFQMLWIEHWTYDTIDVVTPEFVYIDSLRCEVCGGDFFVSSFNVPGIPDYNCGPITIGFDFGCACVSPLDVFVSSTNIGCDGSCAGLWADSNNSSQGLIFEWITPSGNILFGQNVSVCHPGNYTVIVTDFNGCSESNDVFVSENAPDFYVVDNQGAINCDGRCAMLEVIGGGGIYSAQNLSSNSPIGLVGGNVIVACEPGEYEILITDFETGCSIIASYSVIDETTIIEVEIPEPSLITLEVPCVDLAPMISGNGSNNLTYNWEGPDGFESTNLTPEVCQTGMYMITVTDANNGCFGSASVIVDEEEIIITEQIVEAVCIGDCYAFNGIEYCEEGSYTINVNQNYIVELELEILEIPMIDVFVELCPGEEHVVGGETFVEEGIFEVIVPAEIGCDTLFVVDIVYYDELPVLVDQLVETCGNQLQILSPEILEGSELSYSWSTESNSQSIMIQESGIYSLTLSDECGSVVQNYEVVDVNKDDINVYIPNVFSPNDDGVNDEFICVGSDVLDDFTLRIFDRWGNELFNTKNVNEGWNGRFNSNRVPISNYVYIVEYEKQFCDLSTSKATKSGVITLLR